MERIVLNRSATLTKTFYADGVPVNTTGLPTVTVTRQSTGVAVTTGAVNKESGTGIYSVTIAAAENSLLDRYMVDWAATIGGAAQEYLDIVEVAGGTLFTVAELTALKPANITWTAAQVADMRTTVEQAIEDEYGTALVPRWEQRTVSSYATGSIILRDPIRTVRTVTVNGVALSPESLGLLSFDHGYLTGYAWPYSTGTITVGYEYGLDEPHRRIKQAALLLARQWLVKGPIDDRTTVLASPESGITATLAMPGRGGSIFGLPELDAAILSSPYRTAAVA